MSRHEAILRRQIESISSGAWEKLDRLDALSAAISSRIVAVILEFACTAQSIGAISAGREAFERLPREWLATHLEAIVETALDLMDEWSYRRFLELLAGSMPDMFDRYVNSGLTSKSVDIASAADDLRLRARSGD